MKKVGIREAQKHLTTLLKGLPFAITRYGEVIAIVRSSGSGDYIKKGKKVVPKHYKGARF